jgi:hypothetical protein
MYPGSFSSVIYASKLLHMFLTVDEERKFMGIIHPDTGDHYWCTRLLMRQTPGSIQQIWGGFPPPYLSESGRDAGRGFDE